MEAVNFVALSLNSIATGDKHRNVDLTELQLLI